MQIEWRSLSVYFGLKPHVSAWGEDTATLHTHARKNAVTRIHQGHRTLVSRIHLSCQLSAAHVKKKLLTCHLRLVFHLVKQINKYTLLFRGHLPSYSAANGTILWWALPWQEAPWRNLCGQRSHGKRAAGETGCPGRTGEPGTTKKFAMLCFFCSRFFFLDQFDHKFFISLFSPENAFVKICLSKNWKIFHIWIYLA